MLARTWGPRAPSPRCAALTGAGPSAATPRVPLMLARTWGPRAPSPRCAALTGAGPSAATPRVPLMLARTWGPRAPSPRCAALTGAGPSAATPRARLCSRGLGGPGPQARAALCFPSRGDDLFQVGVAGLPAEGAHFGGAGHQTIHIAGAARLHDGGDGVADDAPGGGDDLAHRKAGAVAQIEGAVAEFGNAGGFGLAGEGIESNDVGGGEVADVNVVADAGAVRGGVVVAEDGDRGPLAGGGFEHQRDQVAFGLVALAAASGGAGGIEVAQGKVMQAAAGVPGQQALEEELAQPVGAGGGEGRSFSERRGAGRVDSGGRAEHQAADAGALHGFEQSHRLQGVVVEVLVRLAHRLAHLDEGRHMDDRLDLVLAQHALQLGLIADVALDPAGGGRHRIAVAVGEVVVDGDRVAPLEQGFSHRAADVAGAACNEDIHTSTFIPLGCGLRSLRHARG